MNQIYIPKKIKVGYQKRDDTYSKKLAYVTYYDDKGVLRKENSWNGWIEKNQGIDDFDNEPMEGFVLNRNVGGAKQSYGWNTRIEKVRVYDPRGFEFEIDIPNVLFILQECTSAKGKGLEGTFVYGWNGTSLVLLPTSCEEYKKSTSFTDLQANSVSTKDLVNGRSYKTKKQADLVYLGKFNWFELAYSRSGTDSWSSKKKFIFSDDKNNIIALTNINSLAICNSEEIVSNYAELMDNFNKTIHSSLPVELKEELVIPNPEVILDKHYFRNKDKGDYFLKTPDGKYISVNIQPSDTWGGTNKPTPTTWHIINAYYSFLFNKGKLIRESLPYVSGYNSKNIYCYGSHKEGYRDKIYTIEEIKSLPFYKLSVKLENGKIINARKYC